MSQGDTDEFLIHICPRQDWDAAQKAGEYRAPSLAREGFIHCSHQHQILEVANLFYREVSDLVLLWIDPAKVKSKIKIERPPDGSDELFPHIYGPLNLNAIKSVEAFPIEEDGYYHSIPPKNWRVFRNRRDGTGIS